MLFSPFLTVAAGALPAYQSKYNVCYNVFCVGAGFDTALIIHPPPFYFGTYFKIYLLIFLDFCKRATIKRGGGVFACRGFILVIPERLFLLYLIL